MSSMIFGSGGARLTARLLILGYGLFALTAALSASAQESEQRKPTGSAGQTTNSAGTSQDNRIPAGTILPVVLRTSVSFDECKPGQLLHGQIAQNVPLPNSSTIRRGSQIEGHVVEVTPASKWSGRQSLNSIRQIEL